MPKARNFHFSFGKLSRCNYISLSLWHEWENIVTRLAFSCINSNTSMNNGRCGGGTWKSFLALCSLCEAVGCERIVGWAMNYFFLADYWYHSHYHHFNSAQSCRWLHCIPSQRAFFWFLIRPPQRCEAKTTIHSDGDNDQKHSFQTQQEQSHVVPCRSVECGIMIDYAIDYNVQLGAVEIICDYHCCCFAFSLSLCVYVYCEL